MDTQNEEPKDSSREGESPPTESAETSEAEEVITDDTVSIPVQAIDGTLEEPTDATSDDVLIHQRPHVQAFLVKLEKPVLLIGYTVLAACIYLIFVRIINGLTTPQKEPVGQDQAQSNPFSEILSSLVQVVVDVINQVIGSIFESIPAFDLSWLLWLFVAWCLFIAWLVVRAWVGWFKSYREVSKTKGLTVYSPKSTIFALGTEVNRTVPPELIMDAQESSTILGNTLFLKTVSTVEVLLLDTAGNNDAVSLEYTRKPTEFIAALKEISQPGAVSPTSTRD